jgi:hypothetical protein
MFESSYDLTTYINEKIGYKRLENSRRIMLPNYKIEMKAILTKENTLIEVK